MFSVRPTAALALFTRSLREDNRLKQTYFARAGLVGFILMMLSSAQSSSRYQSAPGLMFFTSVIMTNFFFITLTGLSYFASAIAEEKEDQTLGLLRMTDLGPLTILMGKSTSRLCGVVILLLVQLPFTLLAITLGGVSLAQVAAVYCTLGAYIFFLCNLALLFSVICARVSVATALTTVALLFFFFGPSWGRGVLSLFVFAELVNPSSAFALGVGWFLNALGAASPFGRMETILRTGFAESPVGFQVISDLALGAGCFLLAWLGFDFFTRNQREVTPGRGFVFRRTSRLRALGAGRVWRHAILWKDYHFLWGGAGGRLVRLVIYGLICALCVGGSSSIFYGWGSRWRWDTVGFFLFWIFSIVLAAELAFGAARVFSVETQWKTLSSLAGLPISIGNIAYQKVGAVLLACVPISGGFILLGLGILAVNESGYSISRMLWDDNFWMALFCVGVQFALFLHVTAYFSLLLKRLALPAAVTAMFFGNVFATMCASMFFRYSGASQAMFVMYHCALLALTAVVHRAIGWRLEKLAAEES
jgi:ABC-type transport system involved in multi-copper enzyme maturation permease subunit